MTLVVGIEWRKPYKPVDTIFSPEIAISIFTVEFKGDGFYSGIVPFEVADFTYRIIVTFTPSYIHTHEHLSPVLAFCAAGAGVDLEYGAHPVFLISQHIAEFEILHHIQHKCILFVDFRLSSLAFLVEIEQYTYVINLFPELMVPCCPAF